ncbi:eukaryotic translation initiation factor 4E-1-like [Tasmannia lanceolata]|uniref:eukaryotic translation initiation factor 4E-1-like n=1 Tax=Tasmannia lanceolata TaxID=3420 RepID=UPI004064876C
MAQEVVVVGGGEEEREIERSFLEEVEEGEIVDDSSSLVTNPQPLHLLEHSWTFWFDNLSAKPKQAEWASFIRPIHTFSSVEEFWSLYNNIRHPSKFPTTMRADFHCFKDKIKPEWEDPICVNGGKWTISCARGKSDTRWLYTLLAMIGEQFEYGDEICGAVVNVRPKEEKIALWTKNAANEAAQMSIAKQWKEFLDCNDGIGFIFHEDAMKFDKNAKNRYVL